MRPRRSWFGLLGGLTLVGLATRVAAQPVGSEFRVNTYTTGDQGTFGGNLVAADASGNFVVVWTSYPQDGSRSGVFAQRYDSAGTPLGAEFRANTYTSGDQLGPSVAAAANGNFVIVWASRDQDGSDHGVFGQRYDSGGAAQGSEFRVNSYTTGHQFPGAVASDESGNFVVVWSSGDGDSDGVFAQRYDGAGAPQGAEFRVNSYTTGSQEAASVASDPNGNFVVAWVGQSQDGHGIIGQRFDNQGAPLGSEFRANTYTILAQTSPSIAADGSGNFVVVWQNNDPDGDSFGIFGRRFDSAGTPQGGEFQVNSYTTDPQRYPAVAADANGHFVVAWQSRDQDGNADGIFAQRYDGSGAPFGNEFRVNTFTSHAQEFASAGALGEKLFAVVWQSDLQDGSGSYGVFGQRIDFAGDTIPPTVKVTAPNGGEILYTGSSYPIRWTASDETALSSFDAFVSVDGEETFTPIAECQDVPASATSCLWLAPGPPSPTAIVRVTAEDTSGNRGSDNSNIIFSIVSGTASITVQNPNSEVVLRVGSQERIEWTHNLGLKAAFRIELDRDDDGIPDDLMAAAHPADGPTSGQLDWFVFGQPSATCRIHVSWAGNPLVADASDATFQIRPAPWSEFQVNTYIVSDQLTGSDHLVAADADGNFVVVWSSYGQDGSAEGVFGQRYDNTGTGVGAEFRVNSYTTGSQRQPSVASDASGNFVVVWDSYGQDGDREGIFGQRYDAAGGPLGAEFRVNSVTAGDQDRPSVSSDPSGNFVVVWSGGSSTIMGRRYDSDGVALGPEFRVVFGTQTSFPSVASDTSGNFVVVWFAIENSADIFGQRFNGEGRPLGGEFMVNTYTTSAQSRPSVAYDPRGDFVVVWRGAGGQGASGIFGQRYDSLGKALGNEFRVNPGQAGAPGSSSVAISADGEMVVAWASQGPDAGESGIFGRRYDGAGAPRGDEFQINSFTVGDQEDPSVAAAGAGRVVVAWTSVPAQDGNGRGVFGERLDFGGADTITVVSPNTNVKWRIGSLEKIQWTHDLGPDASFRIELDRDDDGDFEELIAAQAHAANATRGSFTWTVTGTPSGTARVRVSLTGDPGVSDTSDVTFQIRLAPLSATEDRLRR
jgi:hypothetical protein